MTTEPDKATEPGKAEEPKAAEAPAPSFLTPAAKDAVVRFLESIQVAIVAPLGVLVATYANKASAAIEAGTTALLEGPEKPKKKATRKKRQAP